MATETQKELIQKFDDLNNADVELRLNTWESEFLDSIESNLKAEDGYLTDLQIEKLEEIYEKYNR